MGLISITILILVTLLFPPIGVFAVAGCGPDILFNILFTLLGFFPGHIHAFYLIWVYYHRRDQIQQGYPLGDDAVGIFSERVQNGGMSGYVRPQNDQ